MPKVKIVEKDLTGVIQLGQDSSAVYVPCPGTVAQKPKMILSIYKLDAIENIDKEDLSYKLVKRLLRLGMPVVVEVYVKPEGTDKVAVWENLKDRTRFDIRFLTTGAHPEHFEAVDMIECAAVRGDCVALIDHEKELTTESIVDIRKFFENLAGSTIEKTVFGEKVTLETSAFAAGFTP